MARIEHIEGYTWHGRKGDIHNDFRYGIDYLLFDAEAELDLPWFMGRNRRALVSVHDRDYGGPVRQGTGAKWARAVLAAHVPSATGPLLLLTQPRFLGYVFNPISVWIAHNDQGQVCALIAEVTNTFGDRHSYLVAHPQAQPIARGDLIQARKMMHVSPFQVVEGTYEFRFDLRPEVVGLWIDYTHRAGGVTATLTGRRAPLRAGRFWARALRRPFGALRVMALIHWQAVILQLKGALYLRKPPAPEAALSLPLKDEQKTGSPIDGG